MSSWLDFFQTMAILKMNDKIAQQNEQLSVLNQRNNLSPKFTKEDIHKLANQLDSLGHHNEANSLHHIVSDIDTTSIQSALKGTWTMPDEHGNEVLYPHLLDKVNQIINNLQTDSQIVIDQNSNNPIKTMNTKFSNQFEIKLETNSWDDETFVYLTREYKNGICIAENEIGVGKADDPLRRWKEHNAASSKSTTKISFELIYLVKTKEYEKQLHKKLIQLGFTNFTKEVFSGKDYDGNLLTLEYIHNLIKNDCLDGPWAICNGKIVNTEIIIEHHKEKEAQFILENFIHSKNFNPTHVYQIINCIANDKLKFKDLADQYKNNKKILIALLNSFKINEKDIPSDFLQDTDILTALQINQEKIQKENYSHTIKKHLNSGKIISFNDENVKYSDVLESFIIAGFSIDKFDIRILRHIVNSKKFWYPHNNVRKHNMHHLVFLKEYVNSDKFVSNNLLDIDKVVKTLNIIKLIINFWSPFYYFILIMYFCFIIFKYLMDWQDFLTSFGLERYILNDKIFIFFNCLCFVTICINLYFSCKFKPSQYQKLNHFSGFFK